MLAFKIGRKKGENYDIFKIVTFGKSFGYSKNILTITEKKLNNL